MSIRPGQQLPDSIDELDGVVKTAMLLLLLDEESSRAVFRELPAEFQEEVARTLSSIQEVPNLLGESVISEFYDIAMAQGLGREGGLDYAKRLVKDSLDGNLADRLISQIQTQVQRTPFAFLQKAETENLLTFIQDEHPQTIALIVSHLPHHRASEVLGGLQEDRQIEVVRRVANMEQTNPEVIREVEIGLESRLSSMIMHSMEKVGGVDTVAEILNLCDRSTEKSIMEGVETEDPELVEEIRRLMFVFEDIRHIDDKGIQRLLKDLENKELAKALKMATPELTEKFLGNVSTRAAEVIREEMEMMGPVRVSDVEAVQQRIVDMVRRLEDSGEIVISGRGGDGDIVV